MIDPSVKPHGWVYYVRIGEHIKIGYTERFRQRMIALDPDAVLAVEHGLPELEYERHRQFKTLLAKRREFFTPGQELLDHIQSLAGNVIPDSNDVYYPKGLDAYAAAFKHERAQLRASGLTSKEARAQGGWEHAALIGLHIEEKGGDLSDLRIKGTETPKEEVTPEEVTPVSSSGAVVLPAWSRRTVYVLSGLVGACALGASGFELYSLARNAGFAMGVAAALPIGLDAGAAGAAVLWVVGPHKSSLRRQGKITTLLLVAVSAICNGVSVLAVPVRTVVGEQAAAEVSVGFVTFVAFLLAFVFPLVAARAVHLLLSVRDVAGNEPQPAAPLVPARVAMPATTTVAVRPDDVAPDMTALEPATTDDPDGDDTGPLPVPVALDEHAAALATLRQQHGIRGKHKERADLGVGWNRYNAAADQLNARRNGHHRQETHA